jgi:hypothetical protein
LPGPNFDVPRDLFRGTMSEKRVQVVHWLCNSISRHCVNTRDRRPRQIERVGPWYCTVANISISATAGHSHYTIMSTTRRRLVNRIEDVTLGAFGNLQPSDTLNHLIRYLSTWNGSECVLFLFFFFFNLISSQLNGNV